MTYLLIIALAPSPIPSQIPHTILLHSVWMQFDVMTRTHVRQFTLVHVAKCHMTISWIMSSYFPMTGFRSTVCASAVDNRYDCAPTRWGWARGWCKEPLSCHPYQLSDRSDLIQNNCDVYKHLYTLHLCLQPCVLWQGVRCLTCDHVTRRPFSGNPRWPQKKFQFVSEPHTFTVFWFDIRLLSTIDRT